MSALLAFGCAYIAKSQACSGVDNTINSNYKTTSSALGTRNTVSAPNCTAMGSSNNVRGDNSIVMGMNNTVYGKSSVATGLGNTVYGKGSAALGTNNTVMISQYPDYSAYAIGDNNQSVSRMTFAIGDNNVSDGTFSFTIGRRNQSHGSTSYAIGCDNTNTTMAFGCFAIGTNITNNTQNCITIGEHLENNTGGIMMGVNSTNSNRPTLFISKSSGSGATGRVGIGNVTDPQAKLHIKADNSEYAEILLDGAVSSVYFKDKNNSIEVLANQMIFAAPKYSFTNAGITLGKNTATQSPEISFGGANKISVGTDSNTMSFTAGGFSFESQTSMNFISNDFIFVPRREMLVNGSLRVNRSVILTELAGDTARRMVCVNSEGCLETMNVSSVRDNMGNHVAERNIHLNGFKLVNSKDDGGIFLDRNNKVGIGTSTPLYELSVNGTILAKELIVSKLDEDWPDYVFDPEYKLTSLEELGSYVKDERHLPGVPSAKEMEDGGIKVGEMNAILLKKIEELTLYVIELQQQINELKGEQK